MSLATHNSADVTAPLVGRPRLAVLVSGRGSNLQALLDAISSGQLQAEIVGVFSDRPDAAALQRVAPSLRWSDNARAYAERADFDAKLADAVTASRPDWIVCAGYMRILGEDFIARFRGRLLNIHPSLLPKYRGLKTHARALAAGDSEHGASVHFVVPELDAGAVVAQVKMVVHASDTAETLATRLIAREHTLLVAVLALATAGRLAERQDVVYCDDQPLLKPLLLDSAGRLTPSS